MKFLIDTCVISELIKKAPDKKIMEWISSIEEEAIYISALTLGELKKGITKLADSKKKNDLTKWFSQLEIRFKERTISIDPKVAENWGHIMGILEIKGKSLPVVDSLIACSALSHGLTVVTRNHKDMDSTGVEIFNPWK